MAKRVLMISQNFYPEIGSAGNRMKNIYKLLRKKGYSIKLVTTEPSYPNKKTYEDSFFWDDKELNADDDIYRVPINSRKYSRNFKNRLFYYLEMMRKMIVAILRDRQQYDVVFVTSPPIFIGLVGLIAKYKFKNKLILDIRDLWPESLKGVGVFHHPAIIFTFELLEKLLYRKADCIVVNSMGFENHVKKQIGNKPVEIVFTPNGAREYEITQQNHPTDSYKVVYAGNLGLAQNVPLLQELALKLAKSNIGLTIIGYGVEKKSFHQFVELNKLTNISFLSPTTRKDCLGIIEKHDVAIVTLKSKEVFDTVLPGKIIDYMTCKIPIVASVSGYSKEIIERENVGLVTEDGTAGDFFEKIYFLLKRNDLREEMASNCEAFIRKSFMWEKNISTLINCIEKVNGRGRNFNE